MSPSEKAPGDRAQLEPGTLFDGRYRIVDVLGQGSAGTVYAARDQVAAAADDGEAPVDVAVKVLRGGSLHPVVARGFELEFSVLSRLRHPNLVGVERFAITSAGERYHVAELVLGRDLRRAARTLPPVALLPLAHGILLGLDHLHRHGYVHQDVKPSNILVAGVGVRDAQLVAKVADLGTAALLGTDPRGIIAGTLPYLAPERLTGAPADIRSDLWALGMSLFRCATGQLPTRDRTATEILALVRSHRFPPVRDLRPEAPVELEQLVRRLLAPDPGNRYRDAPAALDDVERMLTGLGLEAPRRPVAAVVAGGALVGREQVLSLADSFLAPRPGTRARVLVVRGPTGSGRTRLLRELGLRAQLRGIRTAYVPGGTGLEPWLELLAGLGDRGSRRRSSELVALGLCDQLVRGPALIVCDDLDRRDYIARVLVDRVAAALASSAIPHAAALLVSVESGEDWAPVEPAAFVEQTLEPLGQDAVVELCRSVLGAGAPRSIGETVAREAGGSPSLAVDVLRELLAQGALRQVAGGWGLGEPEAVAVALRQAGVERHLERLSADARRILDVLALMVPAGQGVPLALVEAASAEAPATLSRAIAELCGAQLTRLVSSATGRGTELEILSERVRAACEAEISTQDRTAAHARAYEALRRHPDSSPLALCRHALGAGLASDAIRLASGAAERALDEGDGLSALAALDVAMEAARRALPGAMRAILLRRAEALVRLSRFAEAQEAAREVLTQAPGDLAASLIRARAAIRAGDTAVAESALDHLRGVRDEAAMSLEGELELQVLEVEHAAISRRAAEALRLSEVAREAIDASGSTDRVRVDRLTARVHAGAGRASTELGRHEEAVQQLTRALRLWTDIGDDAAIADVHVQLAAVADMSGDSAAAFVHVAQGITHGERAGAVGSVASLLNVRGIVLNWSGGYEEAVDTWHEAERLARIAGSHGTASAASNNLLVALRCLALYRPSFEAAARTLQVKRRLGNRLAELFTWINLGTIYKDLGDTRVANRIFHRVARMAQEADHDLTYATALLNLADVALARRQVDRAGSLLTRFDTVAPVSVGEHTRMERALIGAHCELARGERDRALSALRAVVETARERRDAYHEAGALLAQGTILGGAGVEFLRQAADVAARARCRGIAWRAHAQLGCRLRADGAEAEGEQQLRRARGALDDVLANLPDRLHRRYLGSPDRRSWVEALQAYGAAGPAQIRDDTEVGLSRLPDSDVTSDVMTQASDTTVDTPSMLMQRGRADEEDDST